MVFSLTCRRAAIGLFVNCYLIAQLGVDAFKRLVVWTVIGVLIYVFYGLRHRCV